MEVRIGIRQSQRELSFESATPAAQLSDTVAKAIAEGSPLLSFTDDKGRHYLVPTESLAYVELGTEETRKIGFVS